MYVCVCVCVCIGDEYMTGEVRESNSHLISSNLRRSGVPVRQIMVIENNLDVLVLMLRRLRQCVPNVYLMCT